jgi:hypothetical protein
MLIDLFLSPTNEPTAFVVTAPDPRVEAVESFLAQRLNESDVWSSPRHSDGVSSLRVVESTSSRLRVCGWIWTIDQTEHAFWLELDRAENKPGVHLTLFYDLELDGRSRSRALRVLDALQHPVNATWREMRTGIMNLDD